MNLANSKDIQKLTLETTDLNASFHMPYHFQVRFTQNLFSPDNDTLLTTLTADTDQPIKLLFFIDANLAAAQPNLIRQIEDYCAAHPLHFSLIAPCIEVQGSEAGKQLTQWQALHQTLLNLRVDRHNLVCAVGGGALLDLIGFVCSSFHRGVPLVRIPSTVLAQNDAGIGVKNGVNALGHKNLLGNFCPPRAVINDFSLLSSLAARDKIAGLAEAVKVALIQDQAFFLWLEEHAQRLANFDAEPSQYAIWRCAQLHLNKITLGGDPFERGNGRPLDYGHWSAHKLEILSDYRIRHGEAVAVGMLLDAIYANLNGMLEQSSVERIRTLLRTLGFKLWYPELTSQDGLLQGLEDFRQHLGGRLSIPLLTSIGQSRDVQHIDTAQMRRALMLLQETESAGTKAES
ncbi:3-dehydroquinate synthase [Bowmanella denitrificans]|uniref:3-dehydroquinate synthase n=1 Tax=Bowmanella denitrificans TaxID=366582 RepID=A0ABN0XY15_9ALTE